MTEDQRRTQEDAAVTGDEDRRGLSQGITVAEAARPQKGLTREKVFELKDVAVAYDGNPAVQEITFDVYKKLNPNATEARLVATGGQWSKPWLRPSQAPLASTRILASTTSAPSTVSTTS